MISAARLGDAFRSNPLVFLDVDEDLWLILHACGKVLSRDNEAAAKGSKVGGKL